MPENGRKGEDLAVKYLEEKGIKIICRNYRYRSGEIDIVAHENETLIFIEVKTWSKLGIEALEYGINSKKQQRIIKTAKYFLLDNRKYRYMAVRFDVIFVTPQGITHLASAFTERV